MEELLTKFPLPESFNNIEAEVEKLRAASVPYINDAEALQTMFSSIDLTTLNTTDSADSVTEFVEKVNKFPTDYPDFHNVGGICVNPVFAPVLASKLKVPNVYKAVVAASFPLSQTFTDIKCAEVRKAVEFGANEIDVVISVGEFLEGNYEFVARELVDIKAACGTARLKVILETGALQTPENIWIASLIAMHAGADMIKTSTGKGIPGASPEAAFVMCQAIKAYEKESKRKVGFKPAGGISTPADAALYYTTVRTILGTDHLTPSLFRIGASRLANALLSKMLEVKTGKPQEIKYF